MMKLRLSRCCLRSSRRCVRASIGLVALALALAGPATAQLLVVSRGDGRVLAYDPNTGAFLAPFVEPVSTGFAFPGGIAVSPLNGLLYVASSASGEIWTYDAITGLAISPPVATGLLAPGPLVFDAAGNNLYFLADVENGPDSDAALWRMAVPGGALTTLASDATASFSALALEGGDLYVSDGFNGEVVRYSTGGGGGTTVVSGLASPAGIMFLSPTAMLIAESGTDRVLEYHESGGSWSFDREVLSAAAGVDGPFGLALAPDGRLSVAGAISNDVVAVDLGSLAVTTFVPSSAGLKIPGQIAWNGNTLRVASRGSNRVRYFDTNGAATGVVAQGLTVPADAGATLSNAGDLLVASVGGNAVTTYDRDTGGGSGTLPNACPLSFTSPFDVATDAAGKLFVSCPSTDGIRTFDEIGISVQFVNLGSGGLSSPRGLAFGPNGNLFVASLSGEVLEYAAGSGNFVGVFVDTAGNGGGPVDPYALAFHQGSLFVTSFFPNEVKEFDASTGAFIQTFVSSGAGGLSGPSGLVFGPTGDLYVASQGDDTVKRYDAATGSFVGDFVTTGSGGLDQPFDLVFLSEPVPVPALGARVRLALVGGLSLAGALSLRRARARGQLGEIA